MLSMGVYRALPEPFARVDPRSGSTVAGARPGAGVLIVLSIVSNNVLGDSISALVLMIVGGVFVIAVATLLIGIVLMAAWNLRAPAFFRGERFTPEWAEAHEPELTELRSG
jgi:hypothetical protein